MAFLIILKLVLELHENPTVDWTLNCTLFMFCVLNLYYDE